MGYKDVSFAHAGHETNFNIGVLPKLKSELFYNVYYKLFDVVHADSDDLVEEAHRLRFQSFCIENQGFEDPSAHPDGLEKDDYDSNSEHVLLYFKPTGKAIGTARVVRPNKAKWESSYPLQTLCDSPYLQDEDFVKNSCEFSRLCISYERRKEVKAVIRDLSGVFNFHSSNQFSVYERPLLNVALAAAPLGLIRGAIELAIKNECMNLFAVMEPKHIARMQHTAALKYEQIGPDMDYHGKRTPFMFNVLDVFDDGIVNNHPVWNVVSDKGENHKRALDLYNKQSETRH